MRKYLGFSAAILVPVVLAFIVVRVAPIAQTLYYSLTTMRLSGGKTQFVGLGNYELLLADDRFLGALRNTTFYAVAVVVLSMLIALPVAAVLAGKIRFSGVYQSLLFLPYITPLVPASITWKWIYDYEYGVLNFLLRTLQLPRVGWLTDAQTSLWSIIIMGVWHVLGYNVIILIVGLRNIPKSLYEAADLDGATATHKFFFITLPLLRPIILFLSVITTISAYNVFAQVYVMITGAQPAPVEGVRVLILDIYENAFLYGRLGYASSEAVILTMIVLGLTFIQFYAIPRREKL